MKIQKLRCHFVHCLYSPSQLLEDMLEFSVLASGNTASLFVSRRSQLNHSSLCNPLLTPKAVRSLFVHHGLIFIHFLCISRLMLCLEQNMVRPLNAVLEKETLVFPYGYKSLAIEEYITLLCLLPINPSTQLVCSKLHFSQNALLLCFYHRCMCRPLLSH